MCYSFFKSMLNYTTLNGNTKANLASECMYSSIEFWTVWLVLVVGGWWPGPPRGWQVGVRWRWPPWHTPHHSVRRVAWLRLRPYMRVVQRKQLATICQNNYTVTVVVLFFSLQIYLNKIDTSGTRQLFGQKQ